MIQLKRVPVTRLSEFDGEVAKWSHEDVCLIQEQAVLAITVNGNTETADYACRQEESPHWLVGHGQASVFQI